MNLNLPLSLVFECVFSFLDGKSIHHFLLTSRYIMDKCEEYEPSMITDDIIKSTYTRMVRHIRVGNFKFHANKVVLYERVSESLAILSRIQSARELHIDTNLERYHFENDYSRESVLACLDHRLTSMKALNTLVVHMVWGYGEYGQRYLKNFIKKCILVHAKILNIEQLTFVFCFDDWIKHKIKHETGTTLRLRVEPKIPKISLFLDFDIPSCLLKNINFYFTGFGIRDIFLKVANVQIRSYGQNYSDTISANDIAIGLCYTRPDNLVYEYPGLNIVGLNRIDSYQSDDESLEENHLSEEDVDESLEENHFNEEEVDEDGGTEESPEF